ncbi:MAG: monovalent cation/H(+) antiporter subunit G [Pseudomonadota bacterium]|nr:MAG: monovalent cation/H(+) antiporter subunit G [Pseudomonadota bacterium]
MISWLGWALCVIGTLVILVAAAGLVRLPDALSRQHAATKAGTVAVIMFATGAALIIQETAWTWRLLVIVMLLMLTLPLASHALSRAATREMSNSNSNLR